MGKEDYTVDGVPKAKAPLFCSLRITLAIVAFFGFFLCYAQRNGLSVGIVCMVDPKADAGHQTNSNSTISRNFPAACKYNEKTIARSPNQVLSWPKSTRGVILGSFYWGYALTQVLGGIAVGYLGPKRFLALLVFLSSLCTLLIPFVAKYHPAIVIILRSITGAAQGGVWPTIFRFWSSWAPAGERTTLLSLQSAGPSMGTIVSLIMGGLFCTMSLSNSVPYFLRYGWSFFYFTLGALGIIWSVVWFLLSADTPATNRFLSRKEKDYILECKAKEQLQDTTAKTPWIDMLKSKAFWAIMIGMFFCDFGLYAIWTVVPEYMNEVLLFSIEENGFFSALPHIASLIVVLTTGYLADYIIREEYVKRVTARKIFHTIGTLSPAICLLAISFLDCTRRYLAVGLLTTGVALNGFMMSGGYVVNVGDFSGVHSGVVFGICNTVSSIGGFCAPYLTSLITKDKTTAQWRIAFMIYAASFFISTIGFFLLVQGETEPWAKKQNTINYDADAEVNKDLIEMKDKKDVIV